MWAKNAAVVIGQGQLGGEFSRGLLRQGHPVLPVLRGMALEPLVRALPEPALVLVTVAEADLADCLHSLPAPWKPRVGLVQNELLPHCWEPHGIAQPTLAVVWFEKKAGTVPRSLCPTVLHGPQTALVQAALGGLGIPTREVDEATMLHELVRKNLFILATNLAGLSVGGTTEQLATTHWDFAREVAADVLLLQEALLGRAVDRDALMERLREDLRLDPTHGCAGRSARARLERALAQAARLELEVPRLAALPPRLAPPASTPGA